MIISVWGVTCGGLGSLDRGSASFSLVGWSWRWPLPVVFKVVSVPVVVLGSEIRSSASIFFPSSSAASSPSSASVTFILGCIGAFPGKMSFLSAFEATFSSGLASGWSWLGWGASNSGAFNFLSIHFVNGILGGLRIIKGDEAEWETGLVDDKYINDVSKFAECFLERLLSGSLSEIPDIDFGFSLLFDFLGGSTGFLAGLFLGRGWWVTALFVARGWQAVAAADWWSWHEVNK